MKRKWINIRTDKSIYWWHCPGQSCIEIVWRENKGSVYWLISCKKCSIQYTVLQVQQNRALIEVIT